MAVGASRSTNDHREPAWRRGTIGTEAVVRAPADGHTLLLVSTTAAINATLYEKLNYNFLRDVTPVASIMRTSNVMVVHPSLPAKTVPEFIAYAKANPGKISMGSAGNGTSNHMSGELFKMMAGVNMVHLPYRGAAPAMTDLLGGQVQVMFDNLPPAIEHIRAGRLRPLAVTTAIRSEALSDVPTVSDFLPGHEASAWTGIGVLKNTPVAIVDALNREINTGLGDPKMKARFADLGGTVLPGSAADFGKLIADETEKWGQGDPGSQHHAGLRLGPDSRCLRSLDFLVRAIRGEVGFRAGFWTPAITRHSACSASRRPKSAKARSRGQLGNG
jgi:tripartite-type tricarboxylate transporter receptor subunit TctC